MEESQALHFNDEEDVGEDFYETIEAPKFVDLTVSDPFRPDDRYWFCSRVGCEQKHPEEMDSEAVYKNFVMRVMAARSPNVRFHRAQRNMKCPLTAPPKSSRSRVSRLALISSISKRIVDARVKSRMPLTKTTATPNVKPKQAHAKALTTPRNRKLNSNTFRSVRNPKTTLAEVPKNKLVAKALVFQSPKKDTKKKTSIDMNTPMKALCGAMKKLEITSAKKDILGGGKPLPLDVSRKKFRGREVKSRVFDSLGTFSSKRQDAKSARVLKRKSKENDLNPLHENIDEASDMEIDEKSRQVSMEGCSLSSSDKSNNNTSKTSESNETSISNSEEENSEESEFKIEVRCGVEDVNSECTDDEERRKAGTTKIISELMDSDEKASVTTVNKENALASIDIENKSEIMVNYEKENVAGATEEEKNQECNYEERIEAGATEIYISELVESDEKACVTTVNKENALASIDIENKSEIMVNYEKENVAGATEEEKNQECNYEERMKAGATKIYISELVESDEKESIETANKENENGNENVAPNDNREDNSHNLSLGVTFGNEKSIKTAKVKGVLKKTLKENSTVGSHGLKSSRPKPTNPKPFRLRTDERGVLREANLEKKLTCPLRDITTSRRLHRDKLRIKSQYKNQSEKCINDCEGENRSEEDEQGRKVPASSNNTKEDSQNCIALKHPKQNLITCQLELGKDKATRKTEDKLKKTKLEKIQRHDRKPQRDVSSRKEINSLVSHPQILSYKDATKPSKSPYRVRRPATIPKEPNFHSSHLPKSCSRKLAGDPLK